jgi:hypothetical protein
VSSRQAPAWTRHISISQPINQRRRVTLFITVYDATANVVHNVTLIFTVHFCFFSSDEFKITYSRCHHGRGGSTPNRASIYSLSTPTAATATATAIVLFYNNGKRFLYGVRPDRPRTRSCHPCPRRPLVARTPPSLASHTTSPTR